MLQDNEANGRKFVCMLKYVCVCVCMCVCVCVCVIVSECTQDTHTCMP